MVAAFVDWGWYLSRQSDLEETTRDAARVGTAATETDAATQAEARVRESLRNLGLDADSATISADTDVDPSLGETVLTLIVSVPTSPPVGLVPSPSALTATVVMLVPS